MVEAALFPFGSSFSSAAELLCSYTLVHTVNFTLLRQEDKAMKIFYMMQTFKKISHRLSVCVSPEDPASPV